MTDTAVLEVYESSLRPLLPPSAALLAAGAFGRGELYPLADVEIVVAYDGQPAPGFAEATAEFGRLLRERGISTNLWVCPLGDCLSATDRSLEHCIWLMDRRTLTADARFGERLEAQIGSFFSKQRRWLAQRLIAAARTRHAGYRNTPSHREPDIQDTPGGLSDLQLVRRLGKLFPDRVSAAFGLESAAARLALIRCFIDYSKHAGNVLDVAAQQEIAAQFGKGATRTEWMRDYFAGARAVFTAARRAMDGCDSGGASLFDAFREAQSRLSNAEFTVLHGHLYVCKPGQFGADQEMVLRLLVFVGQHGIAPAPETERRLEDACASLAAYFEARPLWPALEAILLSPHSAAAVRVLANTGLLRALLPEWAAIEGTVGDGPEQLYTLDEQALMAVERVSELREATDTERRRFAELLSGNEDDAVLQFALLFSGQGRDAAERVQMPAGERSLVEFLIERQSLLSDAASGRDLDDPALSRAMAAQVKTIERLRSLTVFSYARLADTYSEAMVSWRLEQLWRAYLAVQHELARALEADRIEPSAAGPGAGFLEGFPKRYLHSRSPQEIEEHTRLYEQSRPTGTAVELDRVAGGYRLTVVSRDLPALFASFAGAISSFGFDIVKAEAFSNARGIVLDTFVFADPRHTLDSKPEEGERLRELIERVAAGKADAQRLLRSSVTPRKRAQGASSQVEFDSEASDTATLVEIRTEDRPGLLYSLASAFSSNGCNIEVVLIDTKGHRAIDVFYVTRNGVKLTAEEQERLKQQLLAAC